MQYRGLILGDGSEVKASLPKIISASRVCDLPSKGDSLIHILEKGYISRINPFNRKLYYVAFDRVELLVLWSKFPSIIKRHPDYFLKLPYATALMFTLNDYEKEGFEKVPPLLQRIELFKFCSKTLGASQVIWRFDPIIITKTLSPLEITRRFHALAMQLEGYTHRVIFSFLDMRYLKPKQNAAYLNAIELDEKIKLSLIKNLVKIGAQYGIKLQACAQSTDFTIVGAKSDGCIGNYLIKYGKLKLPRDKAQRKLCLCTESRDIGQEYGCSFDCTYCYAFKGIK